MRIYLESNFVLELALQQDEVIHAGEILKLGEDGIVELVFPTFALCEPFSTLSHRSRNRQQLVGRLTQEMRELQRSWLHGPVIPNLESAVGQLAKIEQSERNQLEDTVRRLLQTGHSINLTNLEFNEALRLETRHDLSPQDAIILGSVIGDLKKIPVKEAIFATKNWKDFRTPDIFTELRDLNCQLKDSFEDVLKSIFQNRK